MPPSTDPPLPDPSLLFDYTLPKELIAQEPLANRADARLLVVHRESSSIEHHYFRDLPNLLQVGDRLVLNDTKVIPAQLFGKRTDTGGAWRGLLLGVEPNGDWRIICKTRGKLKEKETITLLDREGRPVQKLWLLDQLGGGEWLAHPEGEETTEELLARVGRMPLPHYIRDGLMVDSDIGDYQTVFARNPGAVAAPTAGLHFTEPLLRTIETQGVEFTSLTLHVGLGTFKPISGSVQEHQMHSEWCELNAQAAQQINATRSEGGRIVAVGTTSVRTLETAARQANGDDAVGPWIGETDIFLQPPHTFGAVDALITNFHFPRTTLLLLVQAFGGTDLIRRAYNEAIREEYRFYSYGDAMLIV